MIDKIDWTTVRKIIESEKKYSHSKEFVELFGGVNDPLPNMKEISADKFWHKLSQWGVGECQSYRQIVGDRTKPTLAVHYFIYGDGTGLAFSVEWDYHKKIDGKNEWVPTFYSFALCEHERKSTLDTNRGWHEGFCTKCGMQMNYDSGD